MRLRVFAIVAITGAGLLAAVIFSARDKSALPEGFVAGNGRVEAEQVEIGLQFFKKPAALFHLIRAGVLPVLDGPNKHADTIRIAARSVVMIVAGRAPERFQFLQRSQHKIQLATFRTTRTNPFAVYTALFDRILKVFVARVGQSQ